MAEFPDEIAFIRKLQAFGQSMDSPCPAEPLSRVISMAFLARSTIAMESVRVLFESGLESDASSIARTIAELAIDLRWILAAPDERTVQFVEYEIVVARRREKLVEALCGSSEHGPGSKKALAASAAGQTLAEFDASRQTAFDRVKDNYPKSPGWTKERIADRAKALGMETLYDTVYRSGCDSLHSSPTTLEGIVRRDEHKRFVFDFGRVAPRSKTALVGASFAYLSVLESCADACAPDRLSELRMIASEFNVLFADHT